MSDETRTSRCFCGAVEVALEGEPIGMAYCHCASCRGWLSAPIHAATGWPTPKVNVRKGTDKLGVFKKTEASHRYFCTICGAAVLVRHPAIGITDVPAGSISTLDFQPTWHVNYGEKVLAVRDGLPKFKDFPEELGGSGVTLPE